jgi:hypothetical protein
MGGLAFGNDVHDHGRRRVTSTADDDAGRAEMKCAGALRLERPVHRQANEAIHDDVRGALSCDDEPRDCSWLCVTDHPIGVLHRQLQVNDVPHTDRGLIDLHL